MPLSYLLRFETCQIRNHDSAHLGWCECDGCDLITDSWQTPCAERCPRIVVAVYKRELGVVPFVFCVGDDISVGFGVAKIHVLVCGVESEYHHLAVNPIVLVLELFGCFSIQFLLYLGYGVVTRSGAYDIGHCKGEWFADSKWCLRVSAILCIDADPDLPVVIKYE